MLGDGANPVDGSHRPDGPAARDRVLSNDELVAIWRACGDDDYGGIVRLLILLGSRRQEIGGMRWSELDLDAGTWALPAARAKNNRAHTITLPPAALDIIWAVLRSTRDNLFGDRASDGFTNWSLAINNQLIVMRRGKCQIRACCTPAKRYCRFLRRVAFAFPGRAAVIKAMLRT